MTDKILVVQTDGGARGNPGPAASGVYISDFSSRQKIASFGRYWGETTNNVAEYRAVVLAMEWLVNHPATTRQYDRIHIVSDSALIVNQINGRFRVKQNHLLSLVFQVRKLSAQINRPVAFLQVKRAFNEEPDRVVNSILNKNTKG